MRGVPSKRRGVFGADAPRAAARPAPIPKRFRLASVPWQVRLVTRGYLKHLIRSDGGQTEEDTYGYTHWARRTVYLDRSLDPITLRLTFLHEREHAIEYTRGNNGGSERDADSRAHLLYDYEQTARGRWDV